MKAQAMETTTWHHYPFDPVPSPRPGAPTTSGSQSEISVHLVKKEEVESKISAWQNAKVAKINNRFKREDAIINGWESEQVQKATSWMKKVEVRKFPLDLVSNNLISQNIFYI
jgi:hypothetical protein